MNTLYKLIICFLVICGTVTWASDGPMHKAIVAPTSELYPVEYCYGGVMYLSLRPYNHNSTLVITSVKMGRDNKVILCN